MRRLSGVAVLLTLLALLAIGVPVHAGGEASFLVDGVTYTLSTGTGAGSCVVESLGAYLGTEVICRDGVQGEARGNTRIGCVSVVGRGACAQGPIVTATPQGSVNCPKGHSFSIESKAEHQNIGTCSTDVTGGMITGGSCDDGKGNMAQVDCSLNGGDGGCTRESGTTRCICTTCTEKAQ